jgi:hypothetical protein
MRNAAMWGVFVAGVVYLAAGLLFGALANEAASQEIRVAWRLAAWVVSAIAFGAHVVYEQVRLRSSPKITALHVASAVGLSAFGLAVAANLHAQRVSLDKHSVMLVLSLAIRPIMAALPASVVALVMANLFNRTWRR